MDMLPAERDPAASMRDLLEQTREFIACFEVAEARMLEWQVRLEARQESQEAQFREQVQTIGQLLESLHARLVQTGLVRFRMQADEALARGTECVRSLQYSAEQLLESMASREAAFAASCELATERLADQAQDGIARIQTALMDYDARAFARIASEASDQVEETAGGMLRQAEKLFRQFHWRVAAVAFLTTLMTILGAGLYIASELPWETHRVAASERTAGKALLRAWPMLSDAERDRILHPAGSGQGRDG